MSPLKLLFGSLPSLFAKFQIIVHHLFESLFPPRPAHSHSNVTKLAEYPAILPKMIWSSWLHSTFVKIPFVLNNITNLISPFLFHSSNYASNRRLFLTLRIGSIRFVKKYCRFFTSSLFINPTRGVME